MDLKFSYVESEKGKQQVLLNGFVYNKERMTNEKSIWKCVSYFKTKCKARLHIVKNVISVPPSEHNHAGEAAKVEVACHMKRIRDEAKKSLPGTTQRILSKESETISISVAAQMPQNHSIKRRIRASRRNNAAGDKYEPIPTNKDFYIPEKYCLTAKKERFIFFDSIAEDSSGNNRIIIFATKENVEILAKSSEWYADGTFSVCPLLFSQLYVIHGIICGHPIPLVFALLPNKMQSTYERLLVALKTEFPYMNPLKVHMDFERGAISAFKIIYPKIKFQLCFFHFKKAVYRKLCTIGLKTKYDTDSSFALKVKHLISLAFVPHDKVIEYFNILIQEKILPEETTSFLNYFEETYIGKIGLGGVRR